MDFDHLNHFVSHDNGDDSGFVDPQDLTLDEPWPTEADGAGDSLQASNYINILPTLDGPSNYARQKLTISPSATRPQATSYRVQKPHVPTRPWRPSAPLPQRQIDNPRQFSSSKQLQAAQRRPVGRVAQHAPPVEIRPLIAPERSRATSIASPFCARCRPLEEATSALKADLIAFKKSVAVSIKAIRSRQDNFQTTFEGFEPEALQWLQETVMELHEAQESIAVQPV